MLDSTLRGLVLSIVLFVATSTALEASFAFGEDVEPFVIAATSVPLARSKLCCGPVIEKPWRCAEPWGPLKLADGALAPRARKTSRVSFHTVENRSLAAGYQWQWITARESNRHELASRGVTGFVRASAYRNGRQPKPSPRA